MGRWEPGAPERLAEAALALYAERGYERTTVADIAAQAGVTERTFFRHFADKREVLFRGSADLLQVMVEAAHSAPESASAYDVVGAALDALAASLGGDRAFSARRSTVVAASVELQERELSKMATLSAGLAAALVERGVDSTRASIVAAAGVGVFRDGFARWVAAAADRPLRDVLREGLALLRETV